MSISTWTLGAWRASVCHPYSHWIVPYSWSSPPGINRATQRVRIYSVWAKVAEAYDTVAVPPGPRKCLPHFFIPPGALLCTWQEISRYQMLALNLFGFNFSLWPLSLISNPQIKKGNPGSRLPLSMMWRILCSSIISFFFFFCIWSNRISLPLPCCHVPSCSPDGVRCLCNVFLANVCVEVKAIGSGAEYSVVCMCCLMHFWKVLLPKA